MKHFLVQSIHTPLAHTQRVWPAENNKKQFGWKSCYISTGPSLPSPKQMINLFVILRNLTTLFHKHPNLRLAQQTFIYFILTRQNKSTFSIYKKITTIQKITINACLLLVPAPARLPSKHLGADPQHSSAGVSVADEHLVHLVPLVPEGRNGTLWRRRPGFPFLRRR